MTFKIMKRLRLRPINENARNMTLGQLESIYDFPWLKAYALFPPPVALKDKYQKKPSRPHLDTYLQKLYRIRMGAPIGSLDVRSAVDRDIVSAYTMPPAFLANWKARINKGEDMFESLEAELDVSRRNVQFRVAATIESRRRAVAGGVQPHDNTAREAFAKDDEVFESLRALSFDELLERFLKAVNEGKDSDKKAIIEAISSRRVGTVPQEATEESARLDRWSRWAWRNNMTWDALAKTLTNKDAVKSKKGSWAEADLDFTPDQGTQPKRL